MSNTNNPAWQMEQRIELLETNLHLLNTAYERLKDEHDRLWQLQNNLNNNTIKIVETLDAKLELLNVHLAKLTAPASERMQLVKELREKMAELAEGAAGH